MCMSNFHGRITKALKFPSILQLCQTSLYLQDVVDISFALLASSYMSLSLSFHMSQHICLSSLKSSQAALLQNCLFDDVLILALHAFILSSLLVVNKSKQGSMQQRFYLFCISQASYLHLFLRYYVVYSALQIFTALSF